MATAEAPARSVPRPQTHTFFLTSCDVTDEADLHALKVRMLRDVGRLERGVHVMVDCTGAHSVSLGIVEVLKQVRQVVELGRSRFVLINVDDAAARRLVEGQGLRIVTGSAELLYAAVPSPDT